LLTEVIVVLAGVILILLLAEVIIKNAIKLAGHFGLSGTFIGLTILSIGTSIPEIMTHIVGSVDIVRDPSQMQTLSGLLLGTSVGSDIFQQNIILGVLGLIATVVVVKKNLFKEAGALIVAAILTWLFAIGGVITRWEGAIMFILYIAYLFYLDRTKKIEKKNKDGLTNFGIGTSFFLIFICFLIMALSAEKVLAASTVLVSTLPISASFFGVFILGIASALPELTTSLIAALKHKKDISAGILLGSNITNPMMGIGIGAMISTYTVPNVLVYLDLPVKIFTGFLIFYFLHKDEDINKKKGIILICIFILYLIARRFLFPVDF
jgi:cation:H+ antiporter